MVHILNQTFDNTIILYTDADGTDHFSGVAIRHIMTDPIDRDIDSNIMIIKKSPKQGKPSQRGMGGLIV